MIPDKVKKEFIDNWKEDLKEAEQGDKWSGRHSIIKSGGRKDGKSE